MIIWQSPHLPAPRRNETPPHGHSAAEKGNLRARPGESRAATAVPGDAVAGPSFASHAVTDAVGVSGTDRCYEPFGAELAVSIPEARMRRLKTA